MERLNEAGRDAGKCVMMAGYWRSWWRGIADSDSRSHCRDSFTKSIEERR